MKPYYKSRNGKLFCGDCLEVLKDFPDNYIDTIITDPPYGINFMGKKWDYDVPSIEIWEECLRVLKPGGTALIFAGSRTQHRMACNVEDAGFILKDVIMWLYGCLSEDTEILTLDGWKHYSKEINSISVLCYDVEKNEFVFDKPSDSFCYENKHTAYRIKSDFTDQIVSTNHRCLIERKGKLIFQRAEELQPKENMPFLESLCDLPESISNLQSGSITKKKDLFQRLQQEKLFKSYQRSPQKEKIIRGYKTTLATVEPIEYKGKVWCVKVLTGAFVARRNGKVFITGNSGFPKSTDISKQLDKGHERKVTGNQSYTSPDIKGNAYESERAKERPRLKVSITEPATPEAKLWDGWRSHGLKPSYEPILLVIKPNDGTYANNALEWGVSGLNIEGSRVNVTEVGGRPKRKELHDRCDDNGNTFKGIKKSGNASGVTNKGRYPANIILDEEAGNQLDEQSGILKSGPLLMKHTHHESEGGASRFFYCSKAPKSERGEFNKHPTVKPLKLIEYLCTMTETPTKGVVLDPFSGSGTTLVACEKTGRKWLAVEISEEYCDIIIKRVKNIEK